MDKERTRHKKEGEGCKDRGEEADGVTVVRAQYNLCHQIYGHVAPAGLRPRGTERVWECSFCARRLQQAIHHLCPSPHSLTFLGSLSSSSPFPLLFPSSLYSTPLYSLVHTQPSTWLLRNNRTARRFGRAQTVLPPPPHSVKTPLPPPPCRTQLLHGLQGRS